MNRFSGREALSIAGLSLLSCQGTGPENGAASSAPPPTLDLQSWIQPVPRTAMLREQGYYVWGGSVVRANDGRYHMFYRRWRMGHGFLAWVSRCETARAARSAGISFRQPTPR